MHTIVCINEVGDNPESGAIIYTGLKSYMTYITSDAQAISGSGAAMWKWLWKHIIDHLRHAVLAVVAVSVIEGGANVSYHYMEKQSKETASTQASPQQLQQPNALQTPDVVRYGNPITADVKKCLDENSTDTSRCQPELDDLNAQTEKDKWLDEEQKCSGALQLFVNKIRNFSWTVIIDEGKRPLRLQNLVKGYIARYRDCMRFNDEPDSALKWLAMRQNELLVQAERRFDDWVRMRAHVLLVWRDNPSASTWKALELELEDAGMLLPPPDMKQVWTPPAPSSAAVAAGPSPPAAASQSVLTSFLTGC